MSGTPEELTPEQAASLDNAGWLDVREPWECDICAFDDAVKIPLRDVPVRLAELDSERQWVVVCHHGVRSLHAVHFLRQQGFPLAQSLAGGIDRWARERDPDMARY